MKYLIIIIILGVTVPGFAQTFKYENSTEKNLLVERSAVCEGNFANAEIIKSVNQGLLDYFVKNNMQYSHPLDDRIHFMVTDSDSTGGKIVYSVTSAYSMFDKSTYLNVKLVYLMSSEKRSEEEIKTLRKVVNKRFGDVMEEMKGVIKKGYQ
ncbi:MAG: hypothetical protein WCK13_06640 [Ignavibacteriota bacterium]|nr:hypothetical protein [Ignavibacteriota bacterium]